MAYTTDPLLGDSDVARSCASSHSAFAEQELGLNLHVAFLAQLRHDAGFIENRVGCTHTALEVELELLHGQCGRNQ